MYRGEVDLVITGADRVARNGDSANKIGTYEKAVVAKENGIPFYIAAPFSTIDFNSASVSINAFISDTQYLNEISIPFDNNFEHLALSKSRNGFYWVFILRFSFGVSRLT